MFANVALGSERVEEPRVEDRGPKRRVVGEHRDQRLARCELLRRRRERRTALDERFRLLRGTVPHVQFVAGGEHVLRHGAAHRAETEKSNLHG